MARAARFRIGSLVVALAIISLAGGAAYSQRDAIARVVASQQDESTPVAARAAQPVRVSRISYGRPAEAAAFTGIVRPRHEADLGFRVSGKLLERLVSVGDRVTTGQPIARLDASDAQLDLESAEAELAAARAELRRADAEASRSQRLLDAGHVSQAAHDRVAATAAEARGRTERALRARELAANRLDYMVLTASSDGVVTRELAEGGQVVGAGQAIVSVAGMDQLDVVFALPEQKRDIIGQASAAAQLWDRDSASYALNLRDVSPDVDPATRTYRVRMGIVAPDQHVTLGRTVTVTFTSPAEKPLASLPLAAVINDGNGAAVWRLRPDGHSVERVPITVAALDGTLAMIGGGISDGDLVVSLGAHKLDPGRPVRVVETTSASLN